MMNSASSDVLRWPLVGRFLRWRHASNGAATCPPVCRLRRSCCTASSAHKSLPPTWPPFFRGCSTAGGSSSRCWRRGTSSAPGARSSSSATPAAACGRHRDGGLAGFASSGSASRCSSQSSSRTSCSICGRCLAPRRGSSWPTSPPPSPSTSCSPGRPSASISVRSGSSASWPRRCRRSKCRCANPAPAGRAGPSIASRVAAMKRSPFVSCAAGVSCRSSFRQKSAISTARCASTACTRARMTMSRWQHGCPGSNWSIPGVDRVLDGCRGAAISPRLRSSSSLAV